MDGTANFGNFWPEILGFSHLRNLELSKGSLSIEVLQKTVEIISLCVEVKLCARTFEMQFKHILYNIY